MSKKQELKHVIKIIHQAAQAYKDNLVGKDFLYVFDNRFIEAKFRVDNFMHFTGVESTLSARRFYQNALNNKLSPSQIFFSKKHPFNLAQKKWNYICGIPTILTTECFMLEKITTQTASYEFGTTNLDCTICLNKELVNGVAKGNYYIAMSLRDEDCFNRSQNQFIVTHIFSKSNASKEYDTLLYMDKGETLCGLPKEIKSQLNSHLKAGEVFVDRCEELFREAKEIFKENPELYAEFLKLQKAYLSEENRQHTPPPSNDMTFVKLFENTEKRYGELCGIITYDKEFRKKYVTARDIYRENQTQKRGSLNPSVKKQPIKPTAKHKK